MEPNAPLASDQEEKHHHPILRVLGRHGGLEPVVIPPQYPPDEGYHHPGITPKINMACAMVV